MNTLNPILATLLRTAGALAGAGVVSFVSDATLLNTLAAAGLAGLVEPGIVRIGAHAIAAAIGFVLASQVVGLLDRSSRTPHGTRSEAAESVPRLRRHLVGGETPKRGSAIPDYLDPDPAPTKPVAVSFAELGLDHPSASEYPMPAGHKAEAGDDFAFAEAPDRPDHAGSASDEWDAPAANLQTAVPASQSGPPEGQMSPARAEAAAQARHLAAAETANAPLAAAQAPEAGAASAQTSGSLPIEAESAVNAAPASASMPEMAEPDSFDRVVAGDASLRSVTDASSGESAETCALGDEVGAAPDLAARSERPAPANGQATPVDASYQQAQPEPAQPRFSLAATGESDLYDGAADEEEDAEDDGAGYGSLIDIGLGKSHAPRGQVGQRGEAGLVPLGGTFALIPHGKPQDFRLREALAELQRLDRV